MTEWDLSKVTVGNKQLKQASKESEWDLSKVSFSTESTKNNQKKQQKNFLDSVASDFFTMGKTSADVAREIRNKVETPDDGSKSKTKKVASVSDVVDLNRAKDKYKKGEKLTLGEAVAVMKYSKAEADRTGTPQMPTIYTLEKLTDPQPKQNHPKIPTVYRLPNRSQPKTAKEELERIEEKFLERTVDILIPNSAKKYANMIDQEIIEEKLSYLDKSERDEYYKKKSVDDFLAFRYLEGKQDKINIQKGLEIADSYINGNFGDKLDAFLYATVGTGATGGMKDLINFPEVLTEAIGGNGNIEYFDTTPAEYANAYLADYFTENGKKFEKTIQDVVVNVANNVTLQGAGMLLGSKTLALLPFAMSVFSGAYQEEVKNGHSSKEATKYALATSGAETAGELLGYLIGGLPTRKGLKAGKFIETLIQNIKSSFLRGMTRLGLSVGSETGEEAFQFALDPYLRNWFLKEDNGTIFNDWDEQKSGLFYSGLIGGASALLMGALPTTVDISTQKSIQNYGKICKTFLKNNNFTIKDIATLGLQSDEKSDLYKTSKEILDGKLKETDYNVGKLFKDVKEFIGGANSFVNELFGQKIKTEPNGVENAIKNYDDMIANGAEFSFKITNLAEKIKADFSAGKEVNSADLGEFVRRTTATAPRAQINGELNKAMQSSENEEISEVVGETENQTPNTEAPQTEITNNFENESPTLAESTDEESDSAKQTVFREPTDQQIFRKPTPQENEEAIFGERKNAKQRHILDVAKKLDKDLKVVFVSNDSNILNGQKGKYVFDTKTMYLAKDLKTSEAYVELFKHEFLHRLELRKSYNSFKNYLFNKSVAFEHYAKTRLRRNGTDTSNLTRQEAIERLTNMYMENFKGDTKIPAKTRESFTREKAEREAVADFVARTLFKGNTPELRVALTGSIDTLVEMETDLDLFSEMAKNDRNLLQKIIDAIRDFINDIKGVPQFKDLRKDLQYLEERLTRVYNSADMKKATTEMEAESYSGNGKVYEKTVDVNDVAWIDPTQGQYAEVENADLEGSYSSDNLDTEYLKAVENGDMETAQRLVDEDIRDSSDDLDIPNQTRELLDRHEKGEITREQLTEELDNLYAKAKEVYGTIKPGEKRQTPADVAVPKAVADDKPTEQFIRTLIETGKLTQDMVDNIDIKTLLGDFSYKVVSDKSAIIDADAAIKNGTAETLWAETVNKGAIISKNQVAVGERLLADAISKKDTLKVLTLASELADAFTRAGQVVQAARLIKKMTGVGKMVSLQQTVNTLNKNLHKKYGANAPVIKISEHVAKLLLNAKSEEAIEQAYQEVLTDIANQMPVTWLDKWNAWRYFAMLANPKTHVRNFFGNLIFLPAVRFKNLVATGMEKAFIKDTSQRTRSVKIKKEYKEFAKKDGQRNEVKQLLKGGKYTDENALKDKQQIFKAKAIEFIAQFNSNALEFEDMLFKNVHYIKALAGYLQARNVDLKNVSEDVLENARIYAVNEARKATFNDESALANQIQNFANKNLFTNFLVEGVLPYKRTPINIVKRGVEYSPVGLMKTLTKGVYDVRKGNISAAEFIDGLASAFTGTGIMLVGMLLANLGLVSGGEEDGEESKFEKMLGKQEYALEFGGKSYTIDWAAPACIPFFIGVEVSNILSEQEDFTLADVSNTIWNSLEPITNLSMLSGMQGVIESARYADSSQTLWAITSDALISYGMQPLPSTLGALGRTIDPTQRSWYIDKNSKVLDTTAQTIKNNIQSKIPGLSYTQTPKIDAWGRTVSRGGLGERVLENFVSPGYFSETQYTSVDKELKRIFKETGEDVFPKEAKKSFSVNKETKYLTAQEYVTYAVAKGQYSFDYIDEFINSTSYNKLSDEEKAEVVSDLYEFANAKAKAEVSDYDLLADGSKFKTVTRWEQNGNSAVTYYIHNAISK